MNRKRKLCSQSDDSNDESYVWSVGEIEAQYINEESFDENLEYMNGEIDKSIQTNNTAKNPLILQNIDKLKERLKNIVINHNVSIILCQEILEALYEYGLNVPRTRKTLLQSTTTQPKQIKVKKFAYEEVEVPVTPSPVSSAQAFSKKTNEVDYLQNLENTEFVSNDISLNPANIEKVKNGITALEVCFNHGQQKIIHELNELKHLFTGYRSQEIFVFPMKTNEEIHKLELKIQDNKSAADFIKIVSNFAPQPHSKCAHFGLAHMFDDDVLLMFNWEGLKNKMAFRDLTNLNNALFMAWKGPVVETFEDYVASIRMQLHAAKSRKNQSNFRKKEKCNNTL